MADCSAANHDWQKKRCEIKDVKNRRRKDEFTLFPGYEMPLCITYRAFKGAVHVWNVSSRNQYADKYHVYQVIFLSSVHLAAELLHGAPWCHGVGFKETQTSQTVVVPQPASARRCGDLVWLLPRRGRTSTWLIPEQDAERKSPPQKQLLSFPNDGVPMKERWRSQVKKNVYFKISARCRLC